MEFLKNIWYWVAIAVLVATNVLTLAHMTVSVQMSQAQTVTSKTEIYNVNDNQNLNLIVNDTSLTERGRVEYKWETVTSMTSLGNVMSRLSVFQQLYLKFATFDSTLWCGYPISMPRTAPVRVSVTNTTTNTRTETNTMTPFMGWLTGKR
jgi:hypothetical protein